VGVDLFWHEVFAEDDGSAGGVFGWGVVGRVGGPWKESEGGRERGNLRDRMPRCLDSVG
jgi:hypothetical protein